MYTTPTSTFADMPVQYTVIFKIVKNENFQWIFFYIFLIFAPKHRLWVHVRTASARGGSNEYPQSMFWSKNKKNRYTPAYPSFAV